jgi:hypothetical protein
LKREEEETQTLKFIAKFAAIGFVIAVVGAVLGLDGATAADIGFGFQMAWVVLRLIPGKAWLAIGEGFVEMTPWIFIASIDL